MYDVVIRGATLVDAHTEIVADLAVTGGKIAAIGVNLPGEAKEVIDGAGLHVFPGLIDPHVHFNEPGRTHWEGFETGTRALAAGGVTTFFDMPLNSDPPLTTVEAFDAKMALMKEKAIVNGYLWGGLIPGNLDQLEGLHERGVIGFKAFMCDSGIPEFPAADDYTLYEGGEIIGSVGSILAVHAENDSITRGLTQKAIQSGNVSVEDYLESRPRTAEDEAIRRILYFAYWLQFKVHIVHLSTSWAIQYVAEFEDFRTRSLQTFSYETCPHYLILEAEDVKRLGPVAKCAPPLREYSESAWIWDMLKEGMIPDLIIGSDHSPSPPEMKQGDNWFKIWGGISGCQSTLSIMLTHGHHEHEIPLKTIAAVTSYNAAERFGLHNKGRLTVGADADLAIVDINAKYTLQAEDLFYRHKISPYVGMTFTGKCVRTIVGGRTVFRDGQIVV